MHCRGIRERTAVTAAARGENPWRGVAMPRTILVLLSEYG